jgi:hypothetical protein
MLPEVAKRGIREALLTGGQGKCESHLAIKSRTRGETYFLCTSLETAMRKQMPNR